MVAGVVFIPLLAPADPEGGTCGRGWYGGKGGYGFGQEWSGAQAESMEKERERFIEETRPLRRQIAEAERALNAVINSDSPDTAKAVELQKALSDLWAQFDRKQLIHRITLRGIMREESGGTNTY